MKHKKRKKNHKFTKFLILATFIIMIIGLYKTGKITTEVSANSEEVNNVIEKEYEEEEEILLVNKDNPLPEDYKVELTEYDNHLVSKEIIDELEKMYKDAKKDGVNLNINTAYRDKKEQQEILDRRIKLYASEGLTQKEAKKKALTEVQLPGCSEHETGLAIDFSNPSKPEDNEPMWKWLNANSYKYGFILRYPKDKMDITKVSNEEWHYRYVGKDIAKEMKNTGECLEEYINRVL